jgi:chemotaxis signal transduction protein
MELQVRIAENDYRCRLGRGGEVGPAPDLTLLPGTPGWLSGLILANEEVMPVVRLARVLGLTEAGSARSELPARMLTFREPGLSVGFLVDEVAAEPDTALPELDLAKVAGALMDRLRSGLEALPG